MATVAAAFFFFRLALSLWMSDMGIFKFLELRQMRRDLGQELADLRLKNGKLAQQVEALRSDPLYIEALAREQLGLVRPGETVYRLVPAQPSDSPTGGKKLPVPSPRPTPLTHD